MPDSHAYKVVSPLNAVHDIENIQGKGKETWNVIVRIGIIRALNESAGSPQSTDKTTLIIKV